MAAILEFWQENTTILKAAGLALLVCAGLWVAATLLRRLVFPFIQKRVNAEKHPIATELLQGLRRPLHVYVRLAGLCCGLLVFTDILQADPSFSTTPFLTGTLPWAAVKALRIGGIVCATWGLVASSGISSIVLRGARHRLDLHMGKSLSRFLAAVYNVVVVAIAITVLLKELNYDINGLIAGLGLGGLTIALAAKDSAANFFGGLVLVLEKPFEIGDWISCAGVEGTVEDINLRSTKVRNAPGSLTIVPNATLSAQPIVNWSGGMEKRRADFILPLARSTPPQQVRDFTAALQTLLETDPEVVTNGIIVRFTDLSSTSLDIKVLFYTALPGYADHLRIRERINYAILALAEQKDIRFAYPTQVLYLNNQGAPPAGG